MQVRIVETAKTEKQERAHDEHLMFRCSFFFRLTTTDPLSTSTKTNQKKPPAAAERSPYPSGRSCLSTRSAHAHSLRTRKCAGDFGRGRQQQRTLGSLNERTTDDAAARRLPSLALTKQNSLLPEPSPFFEKKTQRRLSSFFLSTTTGLIPLRLSPSTAPRSLRGAAAAPPLLSRRRRPSPPPPLRAVSSDADEEIIPLLRPPPTSFTDEQLEALAHPHLLKPGSTVREELEALRDAYLGAEEKALKGEAKLFSENWDGDIYVGSNWNVATVLALVSAVATVGGLVFALATKGVVSFFSLSFLFSGSRFLLSKINERKKLTLRFPLSLHSSSNLFKTAVGARRLLRLLKKF